MGFVSDKKIAGANRFTAFYVMQITVPSPPDLPVAVSPARLASPILAVTRNVNDPRMGPATEP
jgi:hypothetical protein